MQAQIVQEAHHEDIAAGVAFVQEGDPADALYVIREGKVKRNRYDPEGKEYILDIHITGDVLGEDVFLVQDTFNYNIRTISPSKICRISKETIGNLLKTHSEWGMEMLILMSRRLHEANNRVQILMENNALKRIAGFLLARDERLQGEPIMLAIDDIAGSTNLRRETVSRKISALQDRGLLERKGQKQIVITDRVGLYQVFYEG